LTHRAALVGCGAIGSRYADDPRVPGIYSHAAAYDRCPATQLIAVCDVDRAAAAACGARWKVDAVYTDSDALLDQEQPAIVSICTPDATHEALVERALTSPGIKAVIAEKPLAMSVDRARVLQHLAAERGVVLAVNYPRRYSPGHQALRTAIRGGEIGGVQHVTGLYTKGIRHNGSHWFDLARFLVDEITQVVAAPSGSGGDDADPSLDVWMQFAGGATAQLGACDAAAFSVFEMDIIGTRGRLRIIDSGHTVQRHSVEESRYYSGYYALSEASLAANDMRDTSLYLVEDVVRCIEHSGTPACSAADGVAALAVAEAACAAARSGQLQRIDL
jgi:predicted dehydrogenase